MRTQYDKEIKKMKKAMYSSKCDKSIIKSWIKSYEKTLKNKDKLIISYSQAKINLRKIAEGLRQLDQVLSDRKEWSPVKDNQYVNLITMLKGLENEYYHKLLIDENDANYNTRYHSMIELACKYNDFLHNRRRKDDSVMLKSEVENLLNLTDENLTDEDLSDFEVSYFLSNKKIEDLEGLSVKEKQELVSRVYRVEFIGPIKGEIIKMYETNNEEGAEAKALEFIELVTQ
ncbi:hypothetical protein [Lachnobacterium bovis]|uniref:Uncharacterized protein n=1 Tax=Lachnobacterium bovis TaxID=140626 RepID=A0A1H9U1W3_9FIRM|nr:hypothetical protein [Lachnobacterium bovis]SES03359.1 hypothetical protein SAMN02910429_01883 [Lachnobacterium bovis]